ncbi:SsgA family sporulation/cell division regulator [Streptomyces apricus]|uniref:SsgA family sporulation/cell division regulator n=1 Tax=Streptomyces apricus TaxID=1828112 RepID=A0A5B0BFX3_9ACTN|nr:SsgA family sporulation/cell division regulator [Streptomyces apricus]KAA0940232.1 SsgA family sporulation/cell division regulator [Streptomyces apricus]
MSAFISTSLRLTDPFLFTRLTHTALLVANEQPPFPLALTFEYSAHQPFTVVMVLHALGQDVEWNLSREQLLTGLRQHEGCGDIAVWPSVRRQGEEVVRMRLGPPESGVIVEIERATLGAWLESTLGLIPRGSETDHLFLDQVIDDIFETDC